MGKARGHRCVDFELGRGGTAGVLGGLIWSHGSFEFVDTFGRTGIKGYTPNRVTSEVRAKSVSPDWIWRK